MLITFILNPHLFMLNFAEFEFLKLCILLIFQSPNKVIKLFIAKIQ